MLGGRGGGKKNRKRKTVHLYRGGRGARLLHGQLLWGENIESGAAGWG